jgi:formyltetrahydrofolate synthetase
MNMNTGAAKAVIRYLMAGEMLQKSVDAGHGNFYRKVTGTTLASYQKRRVVLSNDHHGVVPQSDGYGEAYVFFWLYLKSMESVEGAILSNVGETVLGTVIGLAGSAAGGAAKTMVTTVNTMRGVPGVAAGAYSGAARADYANGVLSGAERVVAAGAAAAAAGTSNDFGVNASNFEMAGACAITEVDNDFLVWVRYIPTKDELMRKMQIAGNQRSKGKSGDLRYVRSIANEHVWEFDSRTNKFSQVMKHSMQVKRA